MSQGEQRLWFGWNLVSRTDRLSEILFGLIVVLTFTCTLPLTLGEGVTVKQVLLAALSCNIAWGIIDGVMSLIFSAATRSRQYRLLEDLKEASLQEQITATQTWWEEEVSDIPLKEKTAASLVEFFKEIPDLSQKLITVKDLKTAGAVVSLVIAATFPPVIPFILFANLEVAVRVSNIVALLMMVWIGYQLDTHIGRDVFLMRWLVPLGGVFMVIAAIVLGG